MATTEARIRLGHVDLYRIERARELDEIGLDYLLRRADAAVLIEWADRFPVMPANAGYAVEEFARRHGDFAICAVAAVLVRKGARCAKARLATGGTGPMPLRLKSAEAVRGSLPVSYPPAARYDLGHRLVFQFWKSF